MRGARNSLWGNLGEQKSPSGGWDEDLPSSFNCILRAFEMFTSVLTWRTLKLSWTSNSGFEIITPTSHPQTLPSGYRRNS